MRSDQGRLVGLIGAEAALVVGLHALSRLDAFSVDWSEWVGRLSDTAFEDVFGSVVLLVALGLAYWLLLSTVAYLAASFLGRPAVVGAVRRLTLPLVRRLVGRVAALSLAASVVSAPLTPAMANLAGSGSVAEVIVEVDGRRHLPPSGVEDAGDVEDEPSDVIVPPHLRSAPIPDAPVESETLHPATLDGSIEHRVTARRGDHLWRLSERHLQQVLGRPSPGEHAIARYWVRVVEANRGTIRSGDPNLIYPGEFVTLPRVVSDS
jgi:hypothetical protein